MYDYTRLQENNHTIMQYYKTTRLQENNNTNTLVDNPSRRGETNKIKSNYINNKR